MSGGGSSGGLASFQTPSPLYGAENRIFNPLPYPNTGGAAQGAFAGTGNINTLPSVNYGGGGFSNMFGNLAAQGQNAIAGGQQAGAYAPQALRTAFDPQSALYARNFAQNQNQANAVNAMSGVAGTPYGAGVTNQANENFNLDWADRALQRQATGAQTANSLLGAQNAGLGAGGNAMTQGLAGAQSIYGFNNQQLQQQIQDYLAYLQASSGNASAYTNAVNQTTGAASGATNAINYGNQIGNQSTAGLGSLAGTLGGYLLMG